MTDTLTLTPCLTCDTEGRLYRMGSAPSWALEPVEIDCGECPDCQGEGRVLVQTEDVSERERMMEATL